MRGFMFTQSVKINSRLRAPCAADWEDLFRARRANLLVMFTTAYQILFDRLLESLGITPTQLPGMAFRWGLR